MDTQQEPTPEFDPKAYLKTLTNRPGVYRMLGAGGEVIYVGKARNLRRRVGSYFSRHDNAPKTRAMVTHIRGIEVTVTRTENEALILENNLIKEYRPRYNVLLRDDKSYPFIHLSEDEYPRLTYLRGRRRKGRYFGPFPSAGAAKESLNLLQKIFRIRDCRNSYFRNRSRPCLQYQIERCTAPCVGLIDPERYREDIRHAVMVLEGKNNEVIDELAREMESAAERLDFEAAAHYRDQIAALRRVQESQYVSSEGGDIDVIAVAMESGTACVQQFMIRGGRNLGNKTFFPRNAADAEPAEVLGAFVSQHYLGAGGATGDIPPEILVSHEPEGREVLTDVLSQQAGRRVNIAARVRGERARWVDMAVTNARHALVARLASEASLRSRFEALQEALQLDHPPERLECFDISHTMGEATVASCVVFGPEGAVKSDYRRFNIEGIAPGDDYAAMHQALTRRFRRLKAGEGKRPDILLIDGGRGQVAQASAVLDELDLGDILVLGVAKGESRKPGLEKLIPADRSGAIALPADSPALHLIQQVRDEAHRFAIAGHRNRRAKARRTSPLEGIAGLGPKRRQQLLRQFGGLQEIQRAGVEELARVSGISRQLAQRIYDTFHPADG